jgi:hypothetical protein
VIAAVTKDGQPVGGRSHDHLHLVDLYLSVRVEYVALECFLLARSVLEVRVEYLQFALDVDKDRTAELTGRVVDEARPPQLDFPPLNPHGAALADEHHHALAAPRVQVSFVADQFDCAVVVLDRVVLHALSGHVVHEGAVVDYDAAL